jgi:predicted permease
VKHKRLISEVRVENVDLLPSLIFENMLNNDENDSIKTTILIFCSKVLCLLPSLLFVKMLSLQLAQKFQKGENGSNNPLS